MFLSICVALSSISTGTVQTPQGYVPDVGQYTRRISTRSSEAQKQFNRGLNFLFAFNHDEARRSFEAAAKADPKCAMAYWGIAATYAPHINNTEVPPENNKAGFDAASKAMSLSKSATSAERSLISAQRKRFAIPPPADRTALNKAYASAMKQAWKQFPRDADVGALYAESLMDLWPWNLYKPGGAPQPDTNEIVATLEKAIALSPKHPFALHLYIHAVESSAHPERAIFAANRLRDLQPGLGHNVHMPSHVDVRVGQWKEAVIANKKAMAADAKYRAVRPRIGFYRLYMAHNYHMLTFAAMMRGQSALAIKTIDAMVAAIPEASKMEMAPILDGFLAMPIEVRKRFGKWDAVLAAPEFGKEFPIARAMRHAARAVAFAAQGKADEAEFELAALVLARQRVPKEAFFGNNSAHDILEVAEHLTRGEVLIAEKKVEPALAALQRAVRAEDALRYDEPPDWILPARHTLGAYLMTLGRHAEAAQVYRDDLKRWPGNGWALFGLSDALRKEGKATEAAAFKKKFDAVWADADLTIGSSCMCLPGK